MPECWMSCIFHNWCVNVLDKAADGKGYLVTVPIGDDGQPVFMLEGWDMRFSTSEKVFFKCSEIYGYSSIKSLCLPPELDEYYGDIYSLIIGTVQNGILIRRSRSRDYPPS